jgi:hypothetical protein
MDLGLHEIDSSWADQGWRPLVSGLWFPVPG